MKRTLTGIAIVLALAAAVATVELVRARSGKTAPCCVPLLPADTGGADAPMRTNALPRLVDLGADKCIPCRMMAPILDEMRKTYEGQLQVDFIDVWKNPAAGREYGLRVIPTQIFYGPDGKELARHEGFMSREDILGQWAKLGITFEDAGAE